jgi:UDP-N-acetylmuramoyl-L-alanyl-D-glutamate--2,6-diaminopimelate ligase
MTERVLTVAEMLPEVPHSVVFGPAQQPVQGVTCVSGEAVPGGLFAALKGFKRDGRDFVPEALALGARTILSHSGPAGPVPEGVTWIVSPRDREAFSRVCGLFYRTASNPVKVAGVTGTNGKTTVAYLLRSIFLQSGLTGMLGTVEYDDGAGLRPAPRTTPEAHEVHRFLSDLAGRSAPYAVMEVSSHALELHRVSDVPFAAAAFTNLTRDHLDFHGTMEAYFRAKVAFFDLLAPGGTAVVNLENPYGLRLLSEIDGKKILRVGDKPPAEVYPKRVEMDIRGIRMDLVSPAGKFKLESPMAGDFNRQNILVAAATALSMGFPPEAIRAGVASMAGAPGRMERVDAGQPFAVFVDYAHTDDGLKNVLSAVRGLGVGRLGVVFGCGGDRDRTKRPLMGAVAARLGDVVFLTSDNPRTEDPLRILQDVEAGVRPELGPGKEFRKVPDRREAIRDALAAARPGDAVVVAGKGHESEQLLGDRRIPFHDPTVVREILAELGWGGGAPAGGADAR